MTTMLINESLKKSLLSYLVEGGNSELVSTYLFYIQKKLDVHPVLFPKEKAIYLSVEELIATLKKEKNLWNETEIIISFGEESVNEETKRIYICPFTGKVFGNNTHPNPQDAIYDWVSKCPENTERANGLRVKRFFVSEDPEVIEQYRLKEKHRDPIRKKAYSSKISGKLFSSQEGVIKDFKENYIKMMTLDEVQSQNRFQINTNLLTLIQRELTEEKITSFVEAAAEHEEFLPYVQQWIGGEEESD